MDSRKHMSRPKPTVLLTYVDELSGRGYEVTDEYAYYMVLYQGNAFNLKQWPNWDIREFPGTIGPKYPRTCFANPAHCIRLANKLNKENNTDKFTVIQIRNNTTRIIK